MTRPTKPRRLTRLVQTKLTPSRGRQLKKRARQAGMTESGYVRLVIERDLDSKPEGS